MTLKELNDNGTLKFLFDRGFISDTPISYVSYYATYKEYRIKHSYRQSCVFAANDHEVSIETIKRAIKGSVS